MTRQDISRTRGTVAIFVSLDIDYESAPRADAPRPAGWRLETGYDLESEVTDPPQFLLDVVQRALTDGQLEVDTDVEEASWGDAPVAPAEDDDSRRDRGAIALCVTIDVDYEAPPQGQAPRPARLLLDAHYGLEGTMIQTADFLRAIVQRALTDGKLEVITEVSAQADLESRADLAEPTELELVNFLREQIARGRIFPEQLPALLVRFGRLTPEQFLQEMSVLMADA